MDSLRRVFLAVDPLHPRPDVTARVGALARATGAAVVVGAVPQPELSALEALLAALPGWSPPPAPPADAAAEAACGALRILRVDARTTPLAGDPALAIAHAAAREDCHLIVKGAVAGAAPGVFGSADLRLLRHAAPATWIIPPGAPPGRGVLAAVDPDPEVPVRDALARRVIRLAQALARLERRPLTVLSVSRLFAEQALRARLGRGLAEAELESLRAAALAATRTKLAAVTEGVDGEVLLLAGEPDRVIPQTARQRGADVIVMGAIGRGGLGGALIGNTAEVVLAQAPCGVLAVKPEGFASPLLES